jgi:hypothetical protein
MKPFSCPHCSAHLQYLHEEIAANAPAAHTYFLICPMCGNALAIAKRGFRKLHKAEQEELEAQPNYQESRANWEKLRPPDYTLEQMWKVYREQVLHRAALPEVLVAARDIYLSGFAMAMSYFKFIGQLGGDQFLQRMEQLDAELEAFKNETIERSKADKEKMN